MAETKDPFLVSLPDPLGKLIEQSKTDPNAFGKNAMRLAEAIQKAREAEEAAEEVAQRLARSREAARKARQARKKNR